MIEELEQELINPTRCCICKKLFRYGGRNKYGLCSMDYSKLRNSNTRLNLLNFRRQILLAEIRGIKDANKQEINFLNNLKHALLSGDIKTITQIAERIIERKKEIQ